ncbi:MAG: hypothetical protein IH595_09480 [Bacteroidales bacterium]|nr:hypothetical protein [Bacteroidales bacterium]
MKKFFISYLFIFLVFGTGISNAQGYVELQEGKTTNINGIDASYLTMKRKEKKGEDFYRITVTLTNVGGDMIRVFPVAVPNLIRNEKNAFAHFRFINATGRGLSSTNGKVYAEPIRIKVPISVKKCPPPKDPKEDPYEHFMRNYVAGMQFLNGQTITKSFNIRVEEDVVPKVQVLME